MWYSATGAILTQNGFQTILILFLAAGLLPVYQAVNSIRRAFFYRRQRADAIALGRAADGRITEVVRQYVSYEDESHRRPVHRYLCSDRVKVYTDQSGWKHYLEDFQFKKHRSDPDIFNAPRTFEEAHPGAGNFGQIIFVVILVLMILSVIRQ